MSLEMNDAATPRDQGQGTGDVPPADVLLEEGCDPTQTLAGNPHILGVRRGQALRF